MIYEYKCLTCGNIEELNYHMDDVHPDQVVCSKCGNSANRIFNTNAIFPFWMKPEEDGFDYTKHQKTVF
jgi:putative FmdB family regulatory protein